MAARRCQKTNHLLRCLYPVILHIQHLETFQQDVLRWSRHCRREGGLQGPRRQAAQILNGQLQNKAELCVSKQTNKHLHEASWTAGQLDALREQVQAHKLAYKLTYVSY